jgi:hypothetical protein
MSKSAATIPAHKERINEELPTILSAIGRDRYWRQELLFETGCYWLAQQLPPDEYPEIAHEKPFWNWWVLRWESRDFAFKQELNCRDYSNQQALKRYAVYHKLTVLCQDNPLIASFYLNVLSNSKTKKPLVRNAKHSTDH